VPWQAGLSVEATVDTQHRRPLFAAEAPALVQR
jgi:hypothetical protein